VPLAVFTAQNSRNLYTFNFGQAETDRQMLYVDGLLTGRLTAGEVRGFGLGGYLSRRYADLNDDRIGTVRALASKELSRSVWAAAVSAVARGAAIVLLLAAVLFWHQISLTAAATSAIAVAVLAGRLENLGTAGGSLYQQGLLLEDLFSFIELGPWQPETAAAAGYPAGLEGASRAPQDVRVQHVTFTYPGSSQQVLRDVSIEIAPGEVVALVGENGSGKTTLAKIVAGLYLPADGAVVVDGTALDSRLAAGQRLRTAMVFQDFAKYEFTAADNIYMGAVQPGQGPDGFQEQIETAAGMAGADDFLAALPKGYQTMLSRQFGGGTDLSVGQWQRVALARAYFKDAPLIVLDEPTAALDPRSEQALFENVRKLCADRSVLMISHRLSSVREASRIYVLHHGAVVEQGTHDSLMAKQGLYHELFEIQASAYREDPDTAPYETTPTPAS
jgi:ATP-binding cassette subfamily B protein